MADLLTRTVHATPHTATPVRLRLAGLLGLAEASASFRELRRRLEAGGQIALADASPGARAFAWSALVAGGRRVLVVGATEERARRWRAELSGWLGPDTVLSFPERETMPFEIGAPSVTAVHARLATLTRIAGAGPLAVVTSLRALMQHTITPEQLDDRARTIRVGDTVQSQQTARWLLALGYESVPEVNEPGTFSRRGGIIDVYPAAQDAPVRIELFGDDVETLRTFDPVTQRSQEAAGSVLILPTRELSLDGGPELADRLAHAGWEDLAQHEELSSYATIAEPLRQLRYVPGADAFAPALGATASLLDHLATDGTSVVFEDSVELELQWDAHEAQAEERREELRAHGLPIDPLPAQYVGRTAIERAAAERGAVRAGSDRGTLRLGWSSAPSYAGRLDTFLREVAGTGEGIRVVATPQAARLAELLAERDLVRVPEPSLAAAV